MNKMISPVNSTTLPNPGHAIKPKFQFSPQVTW